MFLEVIIEFLEVMQCSWRLCSCSWRLYNVPGGYTMFLEVIQTRVGIELLGQLKKIDTLPLSNFGFSVSPFEYLSNHTNVV